MAQSDDGRRPIRYSLLELIVFICMIVMVQGTITKVLDWCAADMPGGGPLGELIKPRGGSLARTAWVQIPILFVSTVVALLGSAWGSWTATRLKVTSSRSRAGLMALGTLWVGMLPVAVTSLFAIPFLLSAYGFLGFLVLALSWAVVVGANTLPVRLRQQARRDERSRREDERLGALPPRRTRPASPKGPGKDLPFEDELSSDRGGD